MASSVPPKKNTALSFEISLKPRTATGAFQADPTLAAGDVTVSKDGGAFANITSLPTAIGGGSTLTVQLTSAEMNADRIVVKFHDVAGEEWCDKQATIFTAAQTLDETHVRLSEVWALDGLDVANPMTVTPTSRVAGSIEQTISGDGTTTTTVTRDP